MFTDRTLIELVNAAPSSWLRDAWSRYEDYLREVEQGKLIGDYPPDYEPEGWNSYLYEFLYSELEASME